MTWVERWWNLSSYVESSKGCWRSYWIENDRSCSMIVNGTRRKNEELWRSEIPDGCQRKTNSWKIKIRKRRNERSILDDGCNRQSWVLKKGWSYSCNLE